SSTALMAITTPAQKPRGLARYTFSIMPGAYPPRGCVPVTWVPPPSALRGRGRTGYGPALSRAVIMGHDSRLFPAPAAAFPAAQVDVAAAGAAGARRLGCRPAGGPVRPGVPRGAGRTAGSAGRHRRPEGRVRPGPPGG